jgi:hypothetical protein
MFDHRQFIRGCYALPGDPLRDVYILPASGGVDSSALIVMMHAEFPFVDFKCVFTDTEADDDGVYETLDKLEAYLGKKIDRLSPRRGLYQLIEDYNGYLPSSSQRWCTKTLKLQPFENFIGLEKPIFGKIYSFVGIRADEPFRSGLLSYDDDVSTELPFKSWGIVREDVFRILDQTIGIPRYYSYRTRSGCYSCWGMRRMETVGLLEHKPVQFFHAARYEKLSEKDKAKSQTFTPVATELGIGHNWVAFPLPRELDCRNPETQVSVFGDWHFFDLKAIRPANTGKVIPFPARWEGDAATRWKDVLSAKKDQVTAQTSLLDQVDPMNRLWIGVEFRIDPGIGGDGVFWQQFVSFSSTRSGLSRQLQGHYEHRLHTAEAVGLTQEEVRHHVKYALYCIEAPRAYMDVEAPSDGSFTWKRGESYDQVARLTQFAKRTLHAARIEQDARIAQAEGKPRRASALTEQRNALTGPVGRILGMSSFIPREVEQATEEEDPEYVPCFACSI